MKGHSFARMPLIHQYEVGDLFLEIDRHVSAAPMTVRTLDLKPPIPTQQDVDKFFNDLKPKPEDIPALKTALRFLKFDPKDLEEYYEAIDTTITMATSCITVVGAVITVVDFLSGLFGGKGEDASMQHLKHISQRVDQIYGFLGAQEKRGLHNMAISWRAARDNTRNAIGNLRRSRSAENIRAANDLKLVIDQNLGEMLGAGKANIAFWRPTYGYTPGTAHWIDAAVSPYMTLTGGNALDYRNPANDLQSEIWDPGHYIDVLVGSLTDRLMLLAVMEPAFRSTNYDRDKLETIVTGLTNFLNTWRASMIVAHPLVGLNNGGNLQHPNWAAPIGIAIGAVDVVTGVSFFEEFWQGFDRVDYWEWSIEAKGSPDYSRAKHPAAAIAAAIDLQPRLFQAAVTASGIDRLADLRRRVQDMLTRSTVGSDFVELPNATFNLVQMNGPAPTVETVNLGFIGKYSDNPGKQYPGQRYTQLLEKRFRFPMALRADISKVQLGYRMVVGTRNIPLMPYAVAPADGSIPPRFPTVPISVEIHENNWDVYDVYQSDLFSASDEDAFEGIEPPAPSPFLRAVKAFKSERLFLNEHKGPVALKIDIAFETDYNNPKYPYVGHANVTIRNLDPQQCPGGVILPITVYETRALGVGSDTEEVPADTMTVHIVPSFLVVGRDYFNDRREGRERMNGIFGSINDKYAISVQPGPAGPEWQVRRRAYEEVAQHEAIEAFQRNNVEVVEVMRQRFARPTPVRIRE